MQINIALQWHTILTAQKIKFSMLINTYSSKAQEVISTLYSKLMSYPLLKYNCSRDIEQRGWRDPCKAN